MIELGQLESQHDALAKQHLRVVAVSVDGVEDTKAMQTEFPHLTLLSDKDMELAKAVHLVHHGAAPGGADINTPTTLLLDGTGTVRWVYRPNNVMTRLSPTALLSLAKEKLK